MPFTSPLWNPEWIGAILIVLLGAAIVYGVMRNRQRMPKDVQRTEAATKALYAEEDKRQND
ncbi:hypothetical protein [Bradyrhizobium sp. SYSU BS000235]|uniref:hypothetical protein n=1 Tax=Bradyrhizobium sp. SYSU BS000235 TaxID=3411332 RepID=UPI003C756AC7